MNKIITYLAGEHCEVLHNTLVTFFQQIDDEMSTESMVKSFLKWMDFNNLTLTGKKVVFEMAAESGITEEDVNQFHEAFERAHFDPITLVVPPALKISFEPSCEHLKRYYGGENAENQNS